MWKMQAYSQTQQLGDKFSLLASGIVSGNPR
jgi:hypothetical protein